MRPKNGDGRCHGSEPIATVSADLWRCGEEPSGVRLRARTQSPKGVRVVRRRFLGHPSPTAAAAARRHEPTREGAKATEWVWRMTT